MGRFWWEGRASERYWLESTDREDIGADLRAPLKDGSNAENWRYSLFRKASPGDVVFHYDKRAQAITGLSSIAGPAFDAPIVWAARGSYARGRGATPAELPGYRIPLAGYHKLNNPLSLEAIRAMRAQIGTLYHALPKGPRYFPFELKDRPVRPLQGYAFKLPASFVALFDLDPDAGSGPSGVAKVDELAVFQDAVVAIESAAGGYAISGLQQLRTRNRALRQTARTIFGGRQGDHDYVFHRGGRDELQFNLGLDYLADGRRAFRAGVAFSFEPSRSYPDLEMLVPKVARFNAYLREHPEAFDGLVMWHWLGDKRSADYPAQPVSPAIIQRGSFIFLGGCFPLSAIDPQVALQILDRLFPLYAFVEAPPDTDPKPANAPASADAETLRLDKSRAIDGGQWIQATTRVRTLDIYLRHREIQRRLKDQLIEEKAGTVHLEVSVGDRLIDAVVQHDDELWFYEVKTAATVRSCLREAIGQLLEYALWPGATRPHKLIVVGEPALDPVAQAYLEALNLRFPVPIGYRQLLLS